MKDQEKVEMPKNDVVSATFKSTRLINFHTVEVLGRKTLEFRISHRFAPVNSGVNNLYGLEGPAYIRLGLEYSHNGRFMFGLGRSSSGKLIDGFVKYRLLRQNIDNSVPVSISLVESVNLTTSNFVINSQNTIEKYNHLSQRLIYMSQIVIARKFNKSLSLQVSPIFIHYNLVSQITDYNNIYAFEIAGRYKFTKRMAITAEYVFRFNKYSLDFNSYYNSAGLGIDIETGGHVFQIFVTNSFALNEVLIVPYTDTKWNNGGFRIGFNITRAFNFAGKPKD